MQNHESRSRGASSTSLTGGKYAAQPRQPDFAAAALRTPRAPHSFDIPSAGFDRAVGRLRDRFGRLNPQTRTAFLCFSQPFHSLRAAKCSNGIDLNHRSRIYGTKKTRLGASLADVSGSSYLPQTQENGRGSPLASGTTPWTFRLQAAYASPATNCCKQLVAWAGGGA
jgi:hypothetical protein